MNPDQSGFGSPLRLELAPGIVVEIGVDDSRWRMALARTLVDLVAHDSVGPPVAQLQVRSADRGWWVFESGAALPPPVDDPDDVMGLVVGHLNRLLLEHQLHLSHLHAAALSPPPDSPSADNGLLLIGPSGRGKSTLTLGLLSEGWSYLTDESTAVDPSGRALPYPKPVTVKQGSFSQPAAAAYPTSDTGALVSDLGHTTRFIPASSIGAIAQEPQRLTTVISPRFAAGQPAAAAHFGPLECLRRLLLDAFDLQREPHRAIRSLVVIAANSSGAAITYPDTATGIELVEDIASREPGGDRPELVVISAPDRPAVDRGPAAHAGATAIVGGDEAVLVAPDRAILAMVSATVAELWSILDGSRTIADLTDDFGPEVERAIRWLDDSSLLSEPGSGPLPQPWDEAVPDR